MSETNGRSVSYKWVLGVVGFALVSACAAWAIDMNARQRNADVAREAMVREIAEIKTRQVYVVEMLHDLKESGKATNEKLDRNYEALIRHIELGEAKPGKGFTLKANWPAAIVAVCALLTTIISSCKQDQAMRYYHGKEYRQQVEGAAK